MCSFTIYSSIHDHTDSHCFMKLLQGQLKETLFEWPDNKSHGDMVQKSQRILQENKVAYINGEKREKVFSFSCFVFLIRVQPSSLIPLSAINTGCVCVRGQLVKLVPNAVKHNHALLSATEQTSFTCPVPHEIGRCDSEMTVSASSQSKPKFSNRCTCVVSHWSHRS